MRFIILILLTLGLIYFPVETIVFIVGITLIGLIRHVVKMKETADYRASMKGAYERVTDPDYTKPRWFTSPPVAYAMTVVILGLLLYFY